uniref:Uncharacterized protein n=1 Tax=Opuntia streptacantha TaxID=393608 RepID=A0A7C8YHA0_OPUST
MPLPFNQSEVRLFLIPIQAFIHFAHSKPSKSHFSWKSKVRFSFNEKFIINCLFLSSAEGKWTELADFEALGCPLAMANDYSYFAGLWNKFCGDRSDRDPSIALFWNPDCRVDIG